MNKYSSYLIFAAGLIAVGVAVWYFQNIVTYIIVSAVLSLIGAPVVNLLDRVKIKRFTLPKAVCAGLTLFLLWGVFIAFFWTFVPLIVSEAHKLSGIDLNKVLLSLKEPIDNIDSFVNQFSSGKAEQFSTISFLSQRIQSFVSFSLVTNIFGSLASAVGNIFIAMFSISFITFFFLKDQKLFGDGILLFVPTKHEMAAKRVLNSTKDLLVRYFIGISLQITGIIILLSIGLVIVGVNLHTSLVIALFAGIINVIPYIGPLIGSIFGLMLGIISKSLVLAPDQFVPLALSILAVFLVVHLIDNIVFQPFIFSSSVKAHPLEIFLVLLIAGHLAGITGMLLAIPGYTVIRVIAKQFLNNFKVVKKLTEKI
ncbi:MAG TPA: AI-2E family transporter [Bacteroidales bacterium]